MTVKVLSGPVSVIFQGFAPIGPVTLSLSRFCACRGLLSLGGHRSPAGAVSDLAVFAGGRILPCSPKPAMASRGARQRLKGSGSGGGEPASAADKLRELLCSREAGGAEPRTE